MTDLAKEKLLNEEYNINNTIYNKKGEFIFLLDRSGSMSGSRIKLVKEALIYFLHSLPADSYFNIISFGSTFEKMFAQSIKYTEES